MVLFWGDWFCLQLPGFVWFCFGVIGFVWGCLSLFGLILALVGFCLGLFCVCFEVG